MATMTSVVQTEFGGYPFLDEDFEPGRLITAAACSRWRRAHDEESPAASDLARVFDPDEAIKIRSLDVQSRLKWHPLRADRQAQVEEAITTIVGCASGWPPLMRLPVVFGWMPPERTSVSASSFAAPQHIWLAAAAFSSAAVLAEQVLHEMSHQWVYLIEELIPLQRPEAAADVTLPSGTPGRTPSELLGALHVSINLGRLWTKLDVDHDLRTERLSRLGDYIAGCLTLVGSHAEQLTDEGRQFADRLTLECP
jgi:hypothetical protein